MSVPNKKLNPKPSTSAVCFKCGENCTIKDTIACIKCKNRYEFDCIGLSEKLYRLMSNDRKQNWKCSNCKPNLKSKTCVEQSNITLRKKSSLVKKYPPNKLEIMPETPKNIPHQFSSPVSDSEINNGSHIITQEEISDESYNTPERLSRSIELTQVNNTITEYELREENELLKLNLLSAESELESKILENNELNNCVNRLNKELDLLKNLCKLPLNMSFQENTKSHSLQLSRSTTPVRIPASERKTKHAMDLSYLQTVIHDLKESLRNAQIEINDLKKQIITLEQKIIKGNECSDTEPINNSLPNKEQKTRTIHIIGDEQMRGVSLEMLRSRMGKWNDKYTTSATILSGASSSEILPLPLGPRMRTDV